jgi:serine/threonine protein kinase
MCVELQIYHGANGTLCCVSVTQTLSPWNGLSKRLFFFVLVMELCNLGSLKDLIGRVGNPGLSEKASARIGGHILQGLHYLHKNRILHRDVKPDNIGIIGPEGSQQVELVTAKLIDFGFAKRTDTGRSRTIVGSFGYCAPEIESATTTHGPLTEGPVAYDERVDLYSFGVVHFMTMVGLLSTEWNHQEFRAMLAIPGHFLWCCQNYEDHALDSDIVIANLKRSGAYLTIECLTETNPNQRPRDAILVGTLPEGFFANHPDSVPETWFRSVVVESLDTSR